MKAGDRRFDDFGVAGGTMSYHYDNLRCHRWRRACRSDGPLFSMLDVGPISFKCLMYVLNLNSLYINS